LRTNSRERLNYQADLSDTREGRFLYACIPNVVLDPYGYDSDTQSGLNLSDNLGEATVQWRVYALHANTRDVDTVLITYGHVPPGVEVGDVLVSVNIRDLETVKSLMGESNGYFDIDGKFFRPSAINAAGIGWVEEWAVTCKTFSPIYHAPGH